MTDNTGTFTGLGEVYARSRPGYPPALMDLLADRVNAPAAEAAAPTGGVAPASDDPVAEVAAASQPVVADIGAGTGKLTAALLNRGWTTVAVEPNEDMRAALRTSIGDVEGLRVVDAPAERTTLEDSSVSLVTVAQAFHWFDIPAFRAECRRILRPGGQVALIWNFRRKGEPSVEAIADAYRTRVGDFVALTLGERITDADLAEFYGGDHYARYEYDNDELLTWDVFRERHLSMSYTPKEGDPAREPLIADLERIFAAHAVDGYCPFPNATHVVIGELV
ncbi:class I SAM-dependent methyltransferase [Brevibacterium yomogidense]|uniref:class I SAM-dependent methyltransferase n=1 Tax=Brevibacterium yomogidense TaxID=946573 RepID=UPI0018DF813C|nr:class I SAM-dependent methyltransferase [Brevibacterium yomogidense]